MKKKNEKIRFADYLVCSVAVLVAVAFLCIYFYNFFIRFQADYATLFNDTILTNTSNFHNDVINVTNSLFMNKDINAYLYDKDTDMDYSISKLINNTVVNSTIGAYVTDVVVNIPRCDTVFSSMLLGKTTSADFLEEYPEFDEIINNPRKGISVKIMNNQCYYSYNDKGRIVIMVMDAISLKSHLIPHVYPIVHGTVLLNSESETIVSEMNEVPSKVMDCAADLKANSVKIYGNYLISKNSSHTYNCIRFIRISDIL